MNNETEIDNPQQPEPLHLTCEQCKHWRRDPVGDGTGVGRCLLNVRPFLLKWPGQSACENIDLAN